MIGTTAAIIAASAIGAGTSIAGAKMASGAAGKAADSQSQAAMYAADLQKKAADESLAFQKEAFNTQQENLQPWLQSGTTALSGLMKGLGLGPDTAGGPLGYGELMKSFTPNDLYIDPSYEWRVKQGQQALERSAAARGASMSGGTLKELTRYGQDYAATEYQAAFNRFQSDQSTKYNRLAGMAGIGQQATSDANTNAGMYATNTGNILLGSARTIGDLATAASNARASGYVGSANAWSTALGNLGNIGQNAILMSALMNPAAATGSSAAVNMPITQQFPTMPYYPNFLP